MVSSLTCPNCGAGVNSLIGHENPHVFDGILYWSCGVCTYAWVREHTVDLRQIAAENAVQIHMDVRQRLLEELGAPDGKPQDDDQG